MMATKSSLPKNFFLFVVLAFVLWMLAKFSKEYEATILFNVQYVDLPKNKILQNTPPENIPIHIKGTGFKLISAKLFSSKIKLSANNLIPGKKGNQYILLNQQELDIEKQLNSGLSIDYFVQDSVFFDLGTLATKRVPIQIDADIKFMPGFDFVEGLRATPDSLEISGPNGVLDTIKVIRTGRIVMSEINAPINEKMVLLLPSSSVKIMDNIEEVQVYGAVDKYTEGTMEVPYQIDNLPEGLVINAFPKMVKLSFKVGLSNFNKVSANSFVVKCDYSFSSKNELSYLIPKLEMKSDLVKNVKITPNKIDFLIQK